jgi:hypothetical protein
VSQTNALLNHFSFFIRFDSAGLARILAKVGVISDSYNISDAIPRICRNDASKLALSLHARQDPRLTVQIVGMASPKVCENLALLPFRGICSTMKLLGIFHFSNIRETLRMWELNFYSINPIPTIQNPVT